MTPSDFLINVRKYLVDFEADTGKSPRALLVGPREFVLLALAFKDMQTFPLEGTTPEDEAKKGEVPTPSTLFGVPIRVKITAGIEAEIDPKDVGRYLPKQSAIHIPDRKILQ